MMNLERNSNDPSNPYPSEHKIFEVRNIAVHYDDVLAVGPVSMDIPQHHIIAFIGPSGCGKSTLLRCFNRLNDLIPAARVTGNILFHGQDLCGSQVDPVEVRQRIGMVFQKPNPFPKSIYENIAYGARLNGYRKDMDELVERSLKQAALWEEVKDKLSTSGLSLSGGQQQRLCIARAIALEPEVILMDEPCSALDPISTLKIEALMQNLQSQYSIIIVTHNMQQATRVSNMTAFFNVTDGDDNKRSGYLVEYDKTEIIFSSPQERATQEYVSGQFG